MKKILFLGAMAAMLLGTASCSSDMEPTMGGEVPVSFAIDLGDGIDSRTISDGLKANQLKFAVFENGAEITGLAQTVEVANKQATINTKLVKGHTYKFVFWAQDSACTAYNTTNMSAITVNYTADCNDESRDAFYKMDEFQVTEAFEKTEVLTRPFAQINFLASDAAGVVGVDAYKSKVTVTGVPTTLNTLDGTVGTETTDVTFDYATIPNETLAGYESYKYVAMNYILAATDKEVKNEVVLTVNDGTADVNTVTVANCPVQRNYRTNIFGDLFTLDGKFNIEIDPIYAGDHEIDLDATVFNVTTKEEFDAALVSDAKKIVINLPAGEIQYTAGYFYPDNAKCYGGPETQSITIIGQGIDNTTINGVNTYRSWFNTKNPDCVVTLKNLTATSSGNSANTWDGYDFAFSGAVNAENVKFLKPVALSNEGKKTYFKNVMIDATNTPSEAYALWICAGTDVTLENCTLDGVNANPSNGRKNRGMKISDQYCYNGGAVPAMAYLTVKNCVVRGDKKAAILVGNVAGATINVETIDITGVTADNVNAVHIDNGKNEKGLKYTDYMDLVTVTGANCIVEP